MNLTLLLDLDDTLLDNDIDSFLPSYLQYFSQEVADFVPPDQFVSALLGGTREMLKNRRPDCTLRQVFEDFFFHALKVDPRDFKALAEKFYAERFPDLRSLTRPKPEALELVDEAVKRGFRLAIATNPLFPRTAIEQRLRWAGLAPENYPFEVITSYEACHFAKPEPAYFAEVMARLGWPDGPVLMVGDDFERDIAPARKLGLPAFWVTSKEDGSPQGGYSPTASGKMNSILEWLDRVSPETLQPDFTSPNAMLAIMRATPAVLDYLCQEIPESWWTIKPGKGEWCLTEILCHLRDVEGEVSSPRVHLVLDQENPFLPGMDTDQWAVERNYAAQNGIQALRQFFIARVRILEVLEVLEPDDWQRSARHALFGRTQLSELVGIVAGHDRLHLQQVHDLLKFLSS